jgi:hypothetical protein
LSEAVLLEIVQQVKSLEKWSESPERSTMPVPRACDECPRKPVRQPSARASLKREEYRPLTEEERERLREEAEKYFYYAKALLQSLKSIGRANPYVALNIALGCPHVQLEEPKIALELEKELRQLVRPLADLMIKAISREEQHFRQVVESPNLMAYYVDGEYKGLRLVCQDCARQEAEKKTEEERDFPCKASLSGFLVEKCLLQQLKAWLKSNGFEVSDVTGSHDYTFLATKDGRQYLITHRDFFLTSVVEKLKNLGAKIHGLIARNVIPFLLELPLDDEWLAYDLKTDELIRSSALVKLPDVSLEDLIRLIVGQDIGALDHDAIKELYTKLGKERGYLTSEEVQIKEGGAVSGTVDVAWYDRSRKCVMAMEVESYASGPTIANDIYKMKRLNPKIMALIIKKRGGFESIKNYSVEAGESPLLVVYPRIMWVLFERGKIVKMERLDSKKLSFQSKPEPLN